MTTPTPSLLAEIARVQKMEPDAILRDYARFFNAHSTRNVHSLRSEVIYRLQEEHYRVSIQPETSLILNESLTRRGERAERRETHTPGTQYTRVWKGATHVLVFRGDRQYEYNGQIYRSPSTVAKLITGSNWNGREFFHMPPLAKAAKE